MKNRSRGLRPSRGPRGRGIRGGRSSGRGAIRGGLNGRFGSGTPKNPVRERMEKIRFVLRLSLLKISVPLQQL